MRGRDRALNLGVHTPALSLALLLWARLTITLVVRLWNSTTVTSLLFFTTAFATKCSGEPEQAHQQEVTSVDGARPERLLHPIGLRLITMGKNGDGEGNTPGATTVAATWELQQWRR